MRSIVATAVLALQVLVVAGFIEPTQALAQGSRRAGGSLLDPASIIANNSLQRVGNPAFHIQIAISIMDLQGNPEEQGKIDYWWGAAGTHLDLTTPSVGTVHSFSLLGLPNEKARRAVFLAEQLATALIHPDALIGVHDILLAPEVQGETARGGLLCFHHAPTVPERGPTTEACVDQESGTIRTVSLFEEAVSRNRTASFGSTRVALEAEISFAGKTAIAGHVDQLEGIPAQKMPSLLTRGHMLEAAETGSLSGHKPAARYQLTQSPLRKRSCRESLFLAWRYPPLERSLQLLFSRKGVRR